MGRVLVDVNARRFSGLKDKLVYFKLMVDMVGCDIKEFVYDAEKELVGFGMDRYQ